ncbi:MAG: Adenylosuccinate synthetase [Microgenomates bacterium 39_7]|nr:MAG: Adenylosuccinate synthetase [Microgenomates bacterium 39_7]
MSYFRSLYEQVYKRGDLSILDKKSKKSFFNKSGRRANSVAIIGGALGDEGKGRVADEVASRFLQKHPHLIFYRDNGGANAGHTVEYNQTKIVLHQLGAGVLQEKATVIMGKEMVLHPEDLVMEINAVYKALKIKKIPADLKIDEMAFLCLDTHRAFEAVLKMRSTGSKGATGRGIAPAYADVVYRHPLRMRDLASKDWEGKLKKHYELYEQLAAGCGFKLAEIKVPRLEGEPIKLGTFEEMLDRTLKAKKVLKKYIEPVNDLLAKYWASDTPFMIEKAQALGLDKRWGVYPDVTASNCSFDGVLSSTEGIIDHDQLAVRAATIKATYTSSVGSRVLPTQMNEKLAKRIREDANEYGATTGRPRDIVHIDLPMLSFLFKVSKAEELVMTHLDICYQDTPVKVCIAYEIDGREVGYRPDQEFLNKVKPVYLELPAWDGKAVAGAKKFTQLPQEALQYVAFISLALGVRPFMITTGPKREQTIGCY